MKDAILPKNQSILLVHEEASYCFLSTFPYARHRRLSSISPFRKLTLQLGESRAPHDARASPSPGFECILTSMMGAVKTLLSSERRVLRNDVLSALRENAK